MTDNRRRGASPQDPSGYPPVGTTFYLSVALTAGAIIAYQITVMRLFAVANWAHFGSLVVSIAMFGFGVASAILCLGRPRFEKNALAIARWCFLAFGPLMVIGNVGAQSANFNPIFLIADHRQQLKLLANFVGYFAPFLAGAVLLGIAFLVGRHHFQKTYSADMTGSGLAGLLCLGALYLLTPEHLLLAPLALWWGGAMLWFRFTSETRSRWHVSLSALVAILLTFTLPQIEVSPYKGVSYATKFPDATQLYEATGAHGYLQIYGSSYFHFAPGLSDMAALSTSELPLNAYLGLYLDSDGPIGVMKKIRPDQTGYYRYLPMHLPYVVKPQPDRVFVVQFGGGISTQVALGAGSRQVTVAEGNPMILEAFANPAVQELTGQLIQDPRLTVLPVEGRLHLASTQDRFAIVDLSLADSTGLSSPGGFAVTEKFVYSQESMQSYLRALEPGGLLAVTLWNKEDPPKSVLKLFTTMTAAAHQMAGGRADPNAFYVAHVFLSTVTVLYKQGGFTKEEIARLDQHCRDMAYDVVYRPGERWQGDAPAILEGFRRLVLEPHGASDAEPLPETAADEPDLSISNLYRLVLDRLVHQDQLQTLANYPFDLEPLTNDRPYFAGFIRWRDLPRFLDRLESISDEWGYLLLWATLAQAVGIGAILLALPVIFGWRTIFAHQPGKIGILGYFFSLGLGYILVEVALIGKFINALGNPTVSTGVLITGMLVFTGLGSLLSGHYTLSCRRVMPRVFLTTALTLAIYGSYLDTWLAAVGSWSYSARVVACFVMLLPPSLLMGFPFATGMTWLAKLGKEPFFLWAWGINGMFSVVGAVLVPIVAVNHGLSANLFIAGGLYLLAWPCFFGLLKPAPEPKVTGTAKQSCSRASATCSS